MHKDPGHHLLESIKKELRELYGEGFNLFDGTHHARYFKPGVPYHIISRAFQGRYLLRPSKRVNAIIAGVVGRALNENKGVTLYAQVFMSNHLHMMLAGDPTSIVGFMRDVKREVSCRLAKLPHLKWSGTMWHGPYLATGLPTHESQIKCLRYILSHGVKEGLVARPEQWPGIHSAKELLSGKKLKGSWFWSTPYGKKLNAQNRTKKKKSVRQRDFYITYEIELKTIPAWQHLDAKEVRQRIREMVKDIVEEGRKARRGKKPLGAKAVCKMPVSTVSELPDPPWFEDRKAMVCWPSTDREGTWTYVEAFYLFQSAFRRAAGKLKQGLLDVVFPSGSFRPGLATATT